MATTSTPNLPPDPQTLTSWEDAFQHPLPTVRKLEQQLRRSITDNRSKLRSLVGTSYRDLLGTAERIIEMDAQIQVVEGLMGEMGRKCNAGVVERVGRNYGRVKREFGGGDARERRVAQVKVLQNCISVTGRVIKRGGDALVAAKVLVLARMVFKSLSEMEGEPPRILEELRRKLGLVRKRLLGYISRSLSKSGEGEDKERTVKTLCAYSLISSASPRDVLKYFMQVRFEQLEAKAEVAEEGSLLEMLDLYSQTLLDTRELFPRRFADSLGQLSKVALVKDGDVRGVHELSLDVYEQWISDDVRNFHPWVRHDQISSSEVGDALASWTKQAQECLLQGLRDALKEQTNAGAVLEIRQKVLSKYLALSAKVRSDAHAQALEDIRLAFLTRLEDLAAQAAKIADFSVIGEAPDETVPSMWDLATADLDLNAGAMQFRKAVMNRQHGHSPSIATATVALDMWIERLQGFTEILSSMRAIKWDDDLDLELDDLTDGESLQVILSKKDPQTLEARLHQETTAALQDTYRMVEKFLESQYSPTILLRVVREIDRRRRGLGDRIDKLDSVKAQPTFIAALHRQVATYIADEESIRQYCKTVQRPSHTPVTLWDGTPPLPIQPCQGTFRFLKTLHRQMSDTGNDLWSPDAVQALKNHVAEQVAAELNVAELSSTTEASSLTNGHADGADQTEDKENRTNGRNASRDRLVQLQFDMLYLQRIFSSKGGKLEGVVEEFGRQSELDATLQERLKKNASEYWKRTYLLFGLLAVGQTS